MTHVLRQLGLLSAGLFLAGTAYGQQPLPETPVPANPAPFLPDTPVPDDPEPFLLPGMDPAPPPPPVPRPITPLPPLPSTAGKVFQAPFQSYEPALNAEAARLTQLVQIHMLARYNTATIAQVPPWPDYSALVYLMACPQGQYPGCALVCGNRVGAEWSVGGTVTRGLQGVNVTLTFIENLSSREVISFGVALHGTNDRDLLRAIDVFLGKIMAGAFAQVDLRRADVDPAERAKLEAARNQVLAASLAELERKEGAVEREVLEARGPEKIDKDALTEEYKDREEVKPWEAVGLSEGAYVRYKNSGLPLGEWKHKARGRAGTLILRAGLGAGSGPFGQTFDGRYALDDDLARAEVEQFQFVSGAPHAHIDLEAGFGLAPFLDITATYAYRNSQFHYLINQERLGAPVIVDRPVQIAYATWQAGGRVAIVPMPVKNVRPAFHAGVVYWRGTSWQNIIQEVQDLEPMTPMFQILAQVGPGVEITASERVSLFARGLLDLTVAGQTVERFQAGGATLTERADPSTFKTSNAGFAMQGGITVNFRLAKERKVKAEGPASRFEDEDL